MITVQEPASSSSWSKLFHVLLASVYGERMDGTSLLTLRQSLVCCLYRKSSYHYHHYIMIGGEREAHTLKILLVTNLPFPRLETIMLCFSNTTSSNETHT